MVIAALLEEDTEVDAEEVERVFNRVGTNKVINIVHSTLGQQRSLGIPVVAESVDDEIAVSSV
ncbi:hypothetical protein ACHAP3_011239 [Botrytis cinerea]